MEMYSCMNMSEREKEHSYLCHPNRRIISFVVCIFLHYIIHFTRICLSRKRKYIYVTYYKDAKYNALKLTAIGNYNLLVCFPTLRAITLNFFYYAHTINYRTKNYMLIIQPSSLYSS